MSRRKSFRLSSALKSCNRIFDAECAICDKIAAADARRKWEAKVSQPCFGVSRLDRGTPELLRFKARQLTKGWGESLRLRREGWDCPSLKNSYVPDQQGCYESTRGGGGTLATPESSFSPHLNHLRVGVAKTKGKFRVVTMQPARVKRVLTPVHNALYDHISSFGWCVRGDVTRETFAAVVADRRKGESFISGDYSQASDGIFPWATAAVVDALLDEDCLTDEERYVLRASFDNLSWVSRKGVKNPIIRGQMMGSLVGFPILCLINKVCHEIAEDIYYGAPDNADGWRKCVINGDDCAFAGTREFFALWREVTSTFGLTVNEEKTGFDDRYLELNSSVFCSKFGRLLAKPVLSFLRPSRHSADELLPEVIRGVSTFKPSVRLYVINEVMRFEIAAKPINVQSLSRHWLKILVKKKWFREALANPVEVLKRGDDRSPPVSLGPVPKPELYDYVTELSVLESRSWTRWWTGRPARPQSSRVIRRKRHEKKNPFPRVKIRFERPRWRFLWPSGLLDVILCDDYLSRSCFISDEASRSRSVVDHPFLSLEWVFNAVPKRGSLPLFSSVAPPQSLLEGVVRPPARPFEVSGGVNLWSVKQGLKRRRVS
nr:MAG: hypothetical protein [Botourmiaviridae sp.]